MPNYRKLVRIIRDARNARLDYWLAADEALELYQCGKLSFDRDNGCYSLCRWLPPLQPSN